MTTLLMEKENVRNHFDEIAKNYDKIKSVPALVVTDEKGKFTLKGIPEGRHTLFAWSEKYKPREVEATVSSKNTTTVTIDFTQ